MAQARTFLIELQGNGERKIFSFTHPLKTPAPSVTVWVGLDHFPFTAIAPDENSIQLTLPFAIAAGNVIRVLLIG